MEREREGGDDRKRRTGTYNSLGLESSGPELRIRSRRAVTASRVFDLLLASALLVLSIRRLQSKALD
jgi:hypothetical protein